MKTKSVLLRGPGERKSVCHKGESSSSRWGAKREHRGLQASVLLGDVGGGQVGLPKWKSQEDFTGAFECHQVMVRGRQEREIVAEANLIIQVRLLTWAGCLQPVCGYVEAVGEKF